MSDTTTTATGETLAHEVFSTLVRDLRGATAESHLRHAQTYRAIRERFGSDVAVRVADAAGCLG